MKGNQRQREHISQHKRNESKPPITAAIFDHIYDFANRNKRQAKSGPIQNLRVLSNGRANFEIDLAYAFPLFHPRFVLAGGPDNRLP
jgi:hypothetical protein